ncbi:hypothetical protein MMC14_002939 [Varicellaria rhodocarpa]|nr:hypothetical protein [Varicellaria rhodocarpa]
MSLPLQYASSLLNATALEPTANKSQLREPSEIVEAHTSGKCRALIEDILTEPGTRKLNRLTIKVYDDVTGKQIGERKEQRMDDAQGHEYASNGLWHSARYSKLYCHRSSKSRTYVGNGTHIPVQRGSVEGTWSLDVRQGKRE